LAKRMHGPIGHGRFAGIALALFASSLLLTSLALMAAQAVSRSSLVADLVAISIGSAVASVLRFVVLRGWVFRPQASAPKH
jgi:putative flippase GtrA